jgi:integrase
MAKALTAAVVTQLKQRAARYEVSDSAGALRVVVQPSGAKSWAVRYRSPVDGKTVKFTLGSVTDVLVDEPRIGGPLTLAAARKLATAALHEVERGRDPAKSHVRSKEQARTAASEAASSTFPIAARDYVEGYARKNIRRWPELTRALGLMPDTLATIPKSIAARWKDRPIASITSEEVHDVIDEARDGGIPGLRNRFNRESDARGRKLLSALSRMFKWLIKNRRRRYGLKVNPCVAVPAPDPAKVRDRVLTNAEIVAYWKSADAEPGPYGAVLKLILLTGCRLREVSELRWAELSGDMSQFVVPAERSKNHRPHLVPLAPMARSILKTMPKIEGSPWVFTSTGSKPGNGWSKLKCRLDARMTPATPWRLHDVRRTAATRMADECGVEPHIVEATLNHQSGHKGGVAGIYNVAAYREQKAKALEAWASRVELLLAKADGVNVTPLRKAVAK